MNTESVNLRRVSVPRHADSPSLQAGDFAWNFDSESLKDEDGTIYIYLSLPGDQGGWHAIRVQKGASGGNHVWGWDGNSDAPTLTPSILVPGQWHGHLRAGKLESC